MDYQRDPLLAAVARTLRDAAQRYDQHPTPEHARVVVAAHRLAAAAYDALAAARPLPAATPAPAAPPYDRPAAVAEDPRGRGALLRVAEAAELLGVSRTTMYQLVSANAVPVVRIGRLVRVPHDALLRWIDAQARTPDA